MKEIYCGKKQKLSRLAGVLVAGSTLMIGSDSHADNQGLENINNDSAHILVLPMYTSELTVNNLERENEHFLSNQEMLVQNQTLDELTIPVNPALTVTPEPPKLAPAQLPIVRAQSIENSPSFSQNSGKVLTSGESVWLVLADCESGDGQVGAPFSAQWDYNGPSGFDGGLQFHPDTWNRIETGYDYAWQAPPEVQIAAAKVWLSKTSWGQWSSCSNRMTNEGYIEEMQLEGKIR